MLKLILLLVVSLSSLSANAWIGFQILNDPFDYFFSVIATLSFAMFGFAYVIKIFTDL